MNERLTIPARRGLAIQLTAGQRVAVINTHGTQVVDTWAFATEDPNECLSMEHTRAALTKLRPEAGDLLYSSARLPLLKLTEDTSPGIHDTLMAACDQQRYRSLGCVDYHDNCEDNLVNAMAASGVEVSHTPSPLNLFMNIPWTDSGALSFDPPAGSPGDYVVLEAVRDAYLAFSACPQDILPINGVQGEPTEAHVEILP